MNVGDVTQAAVQQTSTFRMLGKDDFFKLLVAQLKLQDPLLPMDNNAMTTQMAQLSSLEQLADLKENTGKLVSLLEGSMIQQSLLFAADMLGKDVVAVDPESNEEIQGTVLGYQFKESDIVLDVDGMEIPASWIIKVTYAGGEG